MAYTDRNFRTKKQLKEAIERGEHVTVYNPGPFSSYIPDGRVSVEGPHYPEPHRWYASVIVEGGRVVSVK